MRNIVIASLAFLVLASASGEDTLEDLQVSKNGRYLEKSGGKPFFWFGDTNWVLFHRTTGEEAEVYFGDRAEKGFTVIQAGLCGAGVIEGVTDPSHNLVNGLLPFHYTGSMPDPGRPNEAFFSHADRMIARAARHGLYLALLPTWAEFVCPAWHNGPRSSMSRMPGPTGSSWAKDMRIPPILSGCWAVTGTLSFATRMTSLSGGPWLKGSGAMTTGT